LRRSYRDELEREDPTALYERLRELDSKAADRIHPHDTVRIIRALEIAELTGEPISEKHEQHRFREARFDCLKIGLYRDREELYRRIDSRAELMVESGLVDETRKIIDMGYSDNSKPLQSLGYKYFIHYIKGRTSLEEALRSMQRDTRHYARRQMTWFRAEGDIEWFHPDEAGPVKERIDTFLKHGRRRPRVAPERLIP
jgi:tRNA dimethylallyltransferase